MQINRENYEAYLLDMCDGELSPEREKELMEFLARNPDLEASHDLLETTLPIPKLNFPSKDDIKKGALTREITKGNFEQSCIARIEGDLSASSERALDNFLAANPECIPVARLYNMLLLKPDKRIHFSRKNLLKKSYPAKKLLPGLFRRRIVHRAVSIAASLAILLSASVFLRNSNQPENSTIPLNQEIALSGKLETSLNISAMTRSNIDRAEISKLNTVNLLSTPSLSDIITPEVIIEDRRESLSNDFIVREPELHPVRAKLLNNIETSSSRQYNRQLQLTSLYRSPVRGYTKQKTLRDNIIYSVSGFLARISDDTSEQERISIWDMADAGLRGINSLAGTEMQLEREYNQEGDIVKMAFNSRFIEIQRSTHSFQD